MSGGIAAIQARIAAIHARFEPVASTGGVLGGAASTPPASPTDSTTGTSAGEFEAALQAALGPSAGAPAATADGAEPMSAAWSSAGRIGTTRPLATVGLVGPPVGGVDSSAPRTPALRLSSYGRLEPPAELVGFGNGRIPPTALAEIGHGAHRLHAPAAVAFRQMEAAASADGVTIGVTDSYRSYDAQVDLAHRKGLYSQGGLAATPGHSNHGWGRSLDLDLDPSALAWMRQHGPDFGYVEDTPREPWHWTYRPA